MNQNYINNQNYHHNHNNDNRFVGGFFGPFLLGGITGALVTPLFYNRPYYNQYPYYYQQYPYMYYRPY